MPPFDHAPETQAPPLAHTLAAALDDATSIDKYAVCCRKYSEQLIYKALGAAKAVPAAKIKKSRAALFFYLVKQYAHHTHDNPRP